jgi:predicted RNase H-like HicB family nuclease
LLGRLEEFRLRIEDSAVSDYHINVFYSEDDDGYIADIPDLKSCSAFGVTPEEAVRELQIAKAAWIESCRANNKPIPRPAYRAAPREAA